MRHLSARSVLSCAAALALATALLGACSADTDSGSADDAASESVAEDGGGQDGGDTAAASDSARPALDLDLQAAGRSLISTATLTVEVDDLDGATDGAAAIATDADGFVSGEQTTRGEDAASTLILKVPPADFPGALEDLADLGKLLDQEITTDDVTEQVVDLESRITTAEASLDRMRVLAEQAQSVADLTTLENELLARETTLEQLRGQQRSLADQVSLATITVTLVPESGAAVGRDDGEDEDDGLPSYLDGLEAGLDVVLAVGSVMLATLGFITPVLPIAAILLLVWWVVRRRDRRAAEKAAAENGAGDPGGDS
jgi:hypothetical protein